MRIAIASSGLGHVARGIEAWAESTAVGISEFMGRTTEGGEDERRETEPWNVCLFGAGPVNTESAIPHLTPHVSRGTFHVSRLTSHVLPCLRRNGVAARLLARLSPPPTWRYGFKSAYGWEQFTFWRRLEPELRRGDFDILHVQDPMLAFWCRRARLAGRLRTREILAHGTEEPPEFRSMFPCLQELAPWHLDELYRALGTKPDEHPLWIALPNFVDTEVFRPVRDDEEKSAVRARLGIGDDALVVGCVAALRCGHKRLDYLVREMARFTSSANTFLLIAGATTNETSKVEAIVEEALPGKCRIVRDVPRKDMPDLYRSMDVFVLPSLFEMMPIAVLEALASGLPVVANRHPVLEWMVGGRLSIADCRLPSGEKVGELPLADCRVPSGNLSVDASARGLGKTDGREVREHGEESVTPSGRLLESGPGAGGRTIDMSKEGELTRCLEGVSAEELRGLGAAARQRAELMFSKRVVLENYVRYYREVLKG